MTAEGPPVDAGRVAQVVTTADREDAYGRAAGLLRRTAGLSPDRSSGARVRAAVETRRGRAGLDLDGYVRLVEDDPVELGALQEEVLVGETHFLRAAPQIEALRRHVLPSLVREAASRRRLALWSAGCSTGEEAWTLALLLAEIVPALGRWDVGVLGSDLSSRALAAAAAGRYGPHSTRMLSPEQRQRWFRTAGDDLVVGEDLRELVRWSRHNLVADPLPVPAGTTDLIVCRHVVIYFDIDTTRAVVDSFWRALRPGGWLLLGPAETLWRVYERLELVQVGAAFLWRRPHTVARRPPVASAPRPRVPASGAGRGDPGAPDAVTLRTAPRNGGDDTPRVGPRTPETADGLVDAGVLDARRHYDNGVAALAAGRDEDAVTSLRRAVYLSPDTGLAHFLLGTALIRIGDLPAARRAYRAAARRLAAMPDEPSDELGGRRPGELAEVSRRLGDR